MFFRQWISLSAMLVAAGSLGGCASTWGQQGHVDAFAKERPAGTCHGTFTGGLTTTFFCAPSIVATGKGGSALALGGSLWGSVPQNDMDPKGNVRDLLVWTGFETGTLEAKTYNSPELMFAGFITSPPKTEWNRTGIKQPIFHDPHAVPPPDSADFHATLVLTSADPKNPHGSLDATLVEATPTGPGAGRAQLHVEF